MLKLHRNLPLLHHHGSCPFFSLLEFKIHVIDNRDLTFHMTLMWVGFQAVT